MAQGLVRVTGSRSKAWRSGRARCIEERAGDVGGFPRAGLSLGRVRLDVRLQGGVGGRLGGFCMLIEEA